MKPLLPRLFLFALIAGTASNGFAGELYRWVDDNGGVHYSDRKPDAPNAEAVNAKNKKEYFNTEHEGSGSSRNELVMYTTTWCEYSNIAREFLRDNGVPFKERDIERSADAKQTHAALGGKGTPFFAYGKDNTLAGFTPKDFMKFYAARKSPTQAVSQTVD